MRSLVKSPSHDNQICCRRRLLFLLSLTWICHDSSERDVLFVADGWTFPIANHHHHRCNPYNRITRQQLQQNSPSPDVATDVLLVEDIRSALVPTTDPSIVPPINEILDSASESLQRIVQTMMTMILKQQQPSETDDARVQQIVKEILQICDDYNEISNSDRSVEATKLDNAIDWTTSLQNIDRDVIKELILQSLHQATTQFQKFSLNYQRYELLVQLMQMNYTTYITTATFLSSDKMQRYELPNVQDVPYISVATTSTAKVDDSAETLVPDCTLTDMEYKDSILDQVLLFIFRSLVTKHTNGVTSSIPGIRGLLEQGRTFMVQQKDSPPEVQHIMVQNTLRDLMTPILPPFYRIFMSGIIPKVQLPYNNVTIHAEEKQYGPWFYAPFLTSYITPIFFKFLVGPSYPNRHRQTGSYGGLLVTKCKFLQESNCKGLCLHQCKIPAQNFFNSTLGLSLNVVPNFVTQECQWSFNEMPITPVSDDPSFPSGCIRGCTSRMIMKEGVTTSSSVGTMCN